jgi:hypothetical protein
VKAICNTEGFIKGSEATGRSIFSALLRISDLLTYGDLAGIVGMESASLMYVPDFPSFPSSFLGDLHTFQEFSLRKS